MRLHSFIQIKAFFYHDSDLMDERVSPVTGDVETVASTLESASERGDSETTLCWIHING